ncbi:hypothetical protein J8J40_29650, partial [Mycobacterium tuberculosis]|nr:hypothetical protein [Mycobacterium tuberculosis]
DKLSLGNFINTATVSNAETIIGGASTDLVTLGNGFTGTVDLGAGLDRLTINAEGATATLSNVETIVAGAGSDVLTLATALSGRSLDL